MPVAKTKKVTNRGARAYHAHRARSAKEQLAKSVAGRDIADGFPRKGNWRRRRRCERDFRLFCETYFPNAFRLEWSPDHLRVIARAQNATLMGGMFAMAMPRGSGKTTLCERLALWALLYGHRRFVCVIGATGQAAERILENIKTELLFNDLLAADFRHVCYPIRKLENNARRCIGQLYHGTQTRITWSADRVTFPTMPSQALDGRDVSGSTITVAGLTGALRGQSHALTTGVTIRPELVILDDPQTRESANSPSQCAERMSIVTGDVLGMAGPGRNISAIMPCTVIREGDLADSLLNRDEFPQWQGERTKAVYAWPKAEKLWEKYREIRAEEQRQGHGTPRSTQFYADRQEAMDAGAEVAWAARKNDDELSPIQGMMNLRFNLKDEAFFAEYQNEPLRSEDDAPPMQTASEIAARLSGVRRGLVPIGAEHLTAFIDVHDALLYWVVAAWSGEFTGWIVDYGTYPDQSRRQFTLRKATKTLQRVHVGAGREGAILAGLTALTGELLGREWQRETEGTSRVARCLVDSGYATNLVYNFCRRSAYANLLLPSRGFGVGAKSKPMQEYQRKQGERHGMNWLVTRTANRATQYMRFDSNFWKSFIHARLAVSVGDPGHLALYGSDTAHHSLISEHLVAEKPTRVTANGRTVDEWGMRPGVADNHWLDCVVGCAVAASMQGAGIPGELAPPTKKRKRVPLAEAMGRGRRLSRRA